MIVPTLRVGMPLVTLRVTTSRADAERPGLHSHAERGNDLLANDAFETATATQLQHQLIAHIQRAYTGGGAGEDYIASLQ